MCSSDQWARRLQTELLGSLAAGVDLGHEMLEVGPGPGAATAWLRHKVGRLLALEIDEAEAEMLAAKLLGTNVEVQVGDATAMTFAEASFDSVGSFTMLHHIPTAAAQGRVLSEMFRVLRPSGVLIGSDSLASTELHEFHADDIYNPIEPSSLLVRLQVLGFWPITMSLNRCLSFVAHKPASATLAGAQLLAGTDVRTTDGKGGSAS